MHSCAVLFLSLTFFLQDFCSSLFFALNKSFPSSSKSDPELFKSFEVLRTAHVTDHLRLLCFDFNSSSRDETCFGAW